MDVYLPGKQTTSSMNNIIMSTRVQHAIHCVQGLYCCVCMHTNGRSQVANNSRVFCSMSACTSINYRRLHAGNVYLSADLYCIHLWTKCPSAVLSVTDLPQIQIICHQPYAAENWFSSTSVISVCLVLFLVSIWSSTLLYNGTLDTMVNDSH